MNCERLFYLGAGIMAGGVVLAIISAICFWISRRKVQLQLDKEYGNPQDYNIKDKGNE